MIYVAILLILAGVLTVKFAFSDKSDKYNGVMIGGKNGKGGESLIMCIAFAGFILFIIGGAMLNGYLGVYNCH
jgi:hypothetical protein